MTARALLLATSCALLAISLLGMFTDQEKEPQMRAGSTSTATPLNGDGRP